jgi:ABC-type multidrug transport system fused ATPase/permease subunit
MLTTLRQCLSLLDAPARWRWAGLIPLAMVSAVLETIGAASVFTLIKIVDDPAQAHSFPGVSTLVALLPWTDDQAIILSCTALVALFYTAKNSVLIIGAYLQNRVVTRSIVTVSQYLLRGYLLAPYAFHFRRNSAELIRNLNDSTDVVFRLFLAPAVAIGSESLVVTGLVTILLLAAPLVTLIAILVLATLFALLSHLTRRFFTRWGAEEHTLKQALLQTLQQSLGGVKEIKVMGRERFFYETFAALQRTLARTLRLRSTLALTPHVFVETLFICGILVVVVLVVVQGGLRAEILPLLGLYAYVGFRVIPSTNRIFMYVNAIRSGTAAVEQLVHDFQVLQQYGVDAADTTIPPELPFTDRITLEQVSYWYEGASEPALQDISMSIRRGESIGIVGATGSGKSTLIDLILGLLQPSSGHITVDGRDIAFQARAWQRQLGYVPQHFFLIDDSLRCNIALGIEESRIDESRVRNAVCLAQLERLVATLPEGLETRIGERGVRLSGGERQRIAIARALYHEPAVLIFDEATSALDQHTERELTRAMEALQGQKTMLIIAHRLTTVRQCDRLFFLHNGRMAGCGSFAELMKRHADFRALVAFSDEKKTNRTVWSCSRCCELSGSP